MLRIIRTVARLMCVAGKRLCLCSLFFLTLCDVTFHTRQPSWKILVCMGNFSNWFLGFLQRRYVMHEQLCWKPCLLNSVQFFSVNFCRQKNSLPHIRGVSEQLALVAWMVFIRTFYKKQKVQSLLSESPFSDGRVTNTLAHPAWSTWSRWDNQSMHTWLGG